MMKFAAKLNAKYSFKFELLNYKLQVSQDHNNAAYFVSFQFCLFCLKKSRFLTFLTKTTNWL